MVEAERQMGIDVESSDGEGAGEKEPTIKYGTLRSLVYVCCQCMEPQGAQSSCVEPGG